VMPMEKGGGGVVVAQSRKGMQTEVFRSSKEGKKGSPTLIPISGKREKWEGKRDKSLEAGEAAKEKKRDVCTLPISH